MNEAVVIAEQRGDCIVKTTRAIGIPPGGTNEQIFVKVGTEDYVGTWQNQAASVLSKIQNTGNTVWVDTEHSSYSGQVVLKSDNTGTNKILTVLEGTLTPVFEIDGNGSILNNGVYTLAEIGTNNSCVLTHSLHSGISTAEKNLFAGYLSGSNITTGRRNTFLGALSALGQLAGSDNVIVGYYAGSISSSFSKNTLIGNQSGQRISGNNNVFLGYFSGNWQTVTSNTFLLHNVDLSNAAAELINSLVYASFNENLYDQRFRVNGVFRIDSFTTTEEGNITPEAGDLILNSTTLKFRGYTGSSWVDLNL